MVIGFALTFNTADCTESMEKNMRSTFNKMAEFMKREDGPTAVEYAVMLALIIVVCIAAVTTLGQNANNTFSFVSGRAVPASS